MTPTEVLQVARETYNAVGDTYWSDSELLSYAYIAELELNREGLIIERTMETDTVADQQEYAKPANCIQIKRLEYNGDKINYVNFDKLSEISGFNSTNAAGGQPRFYTDWNDTLILYPVPDSVGTLKMRVILEPSLQSISGSFDIDTQFHPALVNYLNWRMAIKDSNMPMADRFEKLHIAALEQVRRWKMRKRVGDKMPSVGNVDANPWTRVGVL